MNKIIRYDMVQHASGMDVWNEIEPQADGDYVKFEDHERELAEKDSRIAELELELYNIRYLKADTATRELTEARAEIARLKHENAELSRWKREHLTVTAWWDEIDQFIRKHKDAPLGVSVSTIALNFLHERDRLKAELTAVRVCFAEASHNAGPAFVAHEELARLQAQNEELQRQIAAKDEALEKLLTAVNLRDNHCNSTKNCGCKFCEAYFGAKAALSPDITRKFVRRYGVERLIKTVKTYRDKVRAAEWNDMPERTDLLDALTHADEELAKGEK